MFADIDDYLDLSAGAAGYDMSRTASNSTNMGTVSPTELLMSAPNSAALTALTSPSIYTPDISDSFNVSPAFGTVEGWEHSEHWESLFPDADNYQQPHVADQSPALAGLDLDKAADAGQERRKSSNVSPKSANRHSLVAGVNARKRDKPLPPIVIDDPNDTVAVKRARNTLAARKSRERKAAKMEEYEKELAERDEKILELKQQVEYWKQLALAHGAPGV